MFGINFKKKIQNYYNKKIKHSTQNWVKVYYEELEKFVLGNGLKKNNRLAFQKRMDKQQDMFKNPLCQTWYYAKFRLNYYLFGMTVKEYFDRRMWEKSIYQASQMNTYFRKRWLGSHMNWKKERIFLNDRGMFAEYWKPFTGYRFTVGRYGREAFIDVFKGVDQICVKHLLAESKNKEKMISLTGEDLSEVYHLILEEYGIDFYAEEQKHSEIVYVTTIRNRMTREVSVVESSVSWNESAELYAFCKRAHEFTMNGLDYICWKVGMNDDSGQNQFYLLAGKIYSHNTCHYIQGDYWKTMKDILNVSYDKKDLHFKERMRCFGEQWNYSPERTYEPEGERLLTEYLIRRKMPRMDFRNPITYTEKIQWLKLYDSTPLKSMLADKYRVREYIADKIGSQYLIPLLGVYNDPDEIDFPKLPNRFVIKTNDGYAQNIIVLDKSEMNEDEIRMKIRDFMRITHAYSSLELHYKAIPKKIIIEEYLDNDGESLNDFKVLCFNGKPQSILMIQTESLKNEKLYSDTLKGQKLYYDTNWNELVHLNGGKTFDPPVEKPEALEKMLELASILSEGFILARVDFYILNDGSLKFGEITFTPASGSISWQPPVYNTIIGNRIQIHTDNKKGL